MNRNSLPRSPFNTRLHSRSVELESHDINQINNYEYTSISVRPRSRSNSSSHNRKQLQHHKGSILTKLVYYSIDHMKSIQLQPILYSILAMLCLIGILYLWYFPLTPGWRSSPGNGPKLSDNNDVTGGSSSNTIELIQSKLLILTACSANHYQSLQYMLYSLREYNAQVILYDLGLLQSQRLELIQWNKLVIHRFPFNQYPTHVDIAVEAGQYAWKPIIIELHMADMLKNQHIEQPSSILWIDAGAYFLDINLIQSFIQSAPQGIYIGQSYGTVAQKTSPLMYEWFNEDFNKYSNLINCEAGMIGFQLQQSIYDNIILPWSNCALDADCIAPPGSSRSNHRQDQSVLTYLLHKNHIDIVPQNQRTYRYDGVKTKCDRNMYQWLPTYPSLTAYVWLCLV